MSQSPIIIPVHIQPADIAQFTLRDTLRRCLPVLAIVGAAVVMMLIFHFTMDRQSPFLRMALLIALSVAAIVMFIQSQAKRRAGDARTRRPIQNYEISQIGMVIKRGEQEQKLPWADCKKAALVAECLVFYTKARKAYIIPLRDIRVLPAPTVNKLNDLLAGIFGRKCPRL